MTNATHLTSCWLAAVVLFGGGGTTVAQETIDAADADVTMTSTAASTAFAESVTIVADYDDDGWSDVLVGALNFDPLDGDGFEITNAGAALLFSGQTGAFIRQFDGHEAFGNLGVASIQVPDRDNDGVDDIIVSAPRIANGPDNEAGGFAVFSGATGDRLVTVRGTLGESTSLGSSLAAVGDLNDDGIPEFIAGASGNGGGTEASPGYAVLFDGATLAELHTFTGEEPGANFGRSVAGGGDADDDGLSDIVIGAPLQTTGDPKIQTYSDAGRAYVYSGANYDLLGSVDRFTNDVETPSANFGTSVAFIGDVDGDEHDDFMAGAPEGQQGSGGNGAVVVYSGVDRSVIFDIEGFFATGEQHGTDVLGIGDVNGDGVPDFAGSSSQQCFGFCVSRPGEIIVYSGANAAPMFVYEGEDIGDVFGGSIAAGDLNGDGGTDLVAAAPFRGGHATAPGQVYVFIGPVPGDVNDDGMVDVSDLLQLLGDWGPCPGCPTDLNDDGVVDVTDLLMVLGFWN